MRTLLSPDATWLQWLCTMGYQGILSHQYTLSIHKLLLQLGLKFSYPPFLLQRGEMWSNDFIVEWRVCCHQLWAIPRISNILHLNFENLITIHKSLEEVNKYHLSLFCLLVRPMTLALLQWDNSRTVCVYLDNKWNVPSHTKLAGISTSSVM